MTFKKIVSTGLLVATVGCVAMATAVSAEAKKNVVKRYDVNKIKTYSTYVYGDYSKMYAAPGFTGVCATKDGYEDSYKEAYYYEYTDEGDCYKLYHAYFDKGADEVVISNTRKSVDKYVAERFQVGYIRLTGGKNSNIKDYLYCDIFKDSKEEAERKA